MCKISFIIPNYNTEKEYVYQCLNSITSNETLMQLSEILIIDNKSNEEIFEIVKLYSNRFNNFKIIKLNENKGTGYARNLGINIAKGEYIYFVDNDDFILPAVVLKMLNLIEKNNLEVVFCDTRDIIDGEIFVPKFSHINYGNIKKKYLINVKKEEYPNIMYGWACWRYLLNKCFIINNNILFDEGSIAEDVVFTSKLYTKMEKIGILNNIGYFHRVGVGISKNHHNKNYFKKCIDIYANVLQECNYNPILYYHILYLELVNGILIENITVQEYKKIVLPVLKLIPTEIMESLFDLYKKLYACVIQEDEETFKSFKNVFKYGGNYLT